MTQPTKFPAWCGVAIAFCTLMGCSSAPAIAVVRSEKPRDARPLASDEERTACSVGLRDFSFDLYRKVCKTDGNLCFSPYSLNQTIAMTYAGARGDTASEMAATMHFTLPPDRLHPTIAAIDLALRPEDGKFRLNIANSIWAQTGYSFRGEFLDTLATSYGAEARLVDFKKNAAGARVAINDLIREQTNGNISELIGAGVLTSNTRLVLTNSVYFKADWLTPFNHQGESEFTRLDESEVKVPKMSLRSGFRYVKLGEFEAIELPYVSPGLAMVVFLPAMGSFREVERAFDGQQFTEVLRKLHGGDIQLSMPKFKFASSITLGETLKEMGISSAFTNGANFSGMSNEQPPLRLSDVIQKTLIAVDEKGTEASAATAALIDMTVSMPMKLSIDRPFLFVIHDAKSETILFAGRVLDPSK